MVILVGYHLKDVGFSNIYNAVLVYVYHTVQINTIGKWNRITHYLKIKSKIFKKNISYDYGKI